MREKLLKLLRDKEKEQSFKKEFKSFSEICSPDADEEEFREYCKSNDRNNLLQYDYESFIEEDEAYHMVRAFLAFPNYGCILKNLNDSNYSEGIIRTELRRMESDGLVIIGNQKVQEYILIENGDFSYNLGANWVADTESIILTTKGISKWRYFIYKANENPVYLVISSIALIISIIALFK
jgi:hypothetical protein